MYILAVGVAKINKLIETKNLEFYFFVDRIAQKVERFYQNIVEQSLFGKGKTLEQAWSWSICITIEKYSGQKFSGKTHREILAVKFKH